MADAHWLALKNCILVQNACLLLVVTIDLKIDNLDRVSIDTKIVATFDVEHLIHGTTYGV